MLTLINFGALKLECSWFTILVVSPTLFTLELDSRAAHWSHMSPQLRTIPCVGIIITRLAASSYHHINGLSISGSTVVLVWARSYFVSIPLIYIFFYFIGHIPLIMMMIITIIMMTLTIVVTMMIVILISIVE